jgi:hypothetical protein
LAEDKPKKSKQTPVDDDSMGYAAVWNNNIYSIYIFDTPSASLLGVDWSSQQFCWEKQRSIKLGRFKGEELHADVTLSYGVNQERG